METIKFKNGDVNLSCNVFGEGQPIIFIHGNGGHNKYFTPIASRLASDGYKVYALDSRSHGKSDKVKELNYNDMADDVFALIETQNIVEPILYGFSDGGIIGLLVAIKYPRLLKQLIISGANIEPEGINYITRLGYKFAYTFTRSNKFKMVLTQPHIHLDDLKTIQTPTVVLQGENDFVLESQSRKIANNIAYSQIYIVPKENHSSYVRDNDKLYPILKRFIK